MKRVATILLVLAAATALAASAIAAPAAKKAKVNNVTIVMHDPGCHWFAAGTSLKKSATVNGVALVRNIDEAPMIFKGPGGFHLQLAVGKTVRIAKPGVYHITMLKQAPDDNHLVLRVKA